MCRHLRHQPLLKTVCGKPSNSQPYRRSSEAFSSVLECPILESLFLEGNFRWQESNNPPLWDDRASSVCTHNQKGRENRGPKRARPLQENDLLALKNRYLHLFGDQARYPKLVSI